MFTRRSLLLGSAGFALQGQSRISKKSTDHTGGESPSTPTSSSDLPPAGWTYTLGLPLSGVEAIYGDDYETWAHQHYFESESHTQAFWITPKSVFGIDVVYGWENRAKPKYAASEAIIEQSRILLPSDAKLLDTQKSPSGFSESYQSAYLARILDLMHPGQIGRVGAQRFDDFLEEFQYALDGHFNFSVYYLNEGDPSQIKRIHASLKGINLDKNRGKL